MQISTLGGFVSFFASLSAGAATVIWPESMIAEIIFWISLGGLVASVGWYFYANFSDFFQWGMVLLPDAAREAYRQTKAADTMDMGGPDGRIRYHIDALFEEARKERAFEIFATRPPSTDVVPLPRERISNVRYCEKRNAIFADENKQRLEYEGLQIKRKDLRDHICRWKKIVDDYVSSGGQLVR